MTCQSREKFRPVHVGNPVEMSHNWIRALLTGLVQKLLSKSLDSILYDSVVLEIVDIGDEA